MRTAIHAAAPQYLSVRHLIGGCVPLLQDRVSTIRSLCIGVSAHQKLEHLAGLVTLLGYESLAVFGDCFDEVWLQRQLLPHASLHHLMQRRNLHQIKDRAAEEDMRDGKLPQDIRQPSNKESVVMELPGWRWRS